jgi:hypothetical protein
MNRIVEYRSIKSLHFIVINHYMIKRTITGDAKNAVGVYIIGNLVRCINRWIRKNNAFEYYCASPKSNEAMERQ